MKIIKVRGIKKYNPNTIPGHKLADIFANSRIDTKLLQELDKTLAN